MCLVRCSGCLDSNTTEPPKTPPHISGFPPRSLLENFCKNHQTVSLKTWTIMMVESTWVDVRNYENSLAFNMKSNSLRVTRKSFFFLHKNSCEFSKNLCEFFKQKLSQIFFKNHMNPSPNSLPCDFCRKSVIFLFEKSHDFFENI